MTTDAVGGVWTYALDLVETLAERDVEVVLVTLGPPPDPARRARLRRAPVADYHERPYALEWADGAERDADAAGAWLVELAEDERADLVHLNGYALAAWPFRTPVVVVAHSCVLSWHEAVRGRPAGPEWSAYRGAVAAGLAAATAIVAPTRAMLAEIERLYAPPGERLVIPNGRAPRGLRPLPKEDFVLGAGRVWDEAKNLAALERVAPRLAWPVVVAGEGGRLGHVPDERLAELLGRASIFAEPARYEPFGLAALEAGLAGCALVLGNIASLREVWGEAALFVDPFDDDALATALHALIDDDAGRRELGTAARRCALGYAPARTAAAYAALYERLAARVAVSG